MSDHFLQAENVTKFYGPAANREAALRGVNLQVQEGEILAIYGPSGCGKSTLLHILGAMDRPTDGQIWLRGNRLDTLSLTELAVIRRKHVGFVFQAFNLLPTLTVAENVSLPLMLDGASAKTCTLRASAALADVGLQSFGKRYPSQLSGGEMQRVAIARALAIEPQLIIADEPTGSLDSVNGHRVLELLAGLNASKRITVLIATHALEAAAYTTRLIHLKDGMIEKDSASRDVPAAL